MDISGVDVDCLSDEEILELCSDIVDCSNEEISVLKGVDVNNLSDDKVQEIYDAVISVNPAPIKQVQKISELNNDIVDENPDEIILINGQKVNIDELSDDEILAFYDDIIDNGDLLAYDTTTYTCSNFETTKYGLAADSTYGSVTGAYMYCNGRKFAVHCNYIYAAYTYLCRIWIIAKNGTGSAKFQCTGYLKGQMTVCLYYTYGYAFSYSGFGYQCNSNYRTTYMCK